MNYVDKQLSSRLQLQDYRDWVIGYDRIFNTMLNQPTNSITNKPNYPPHNLIEYEDGKYTITLAIAGISKEDLNITLEEQNLTISYDGKETESNGKILYRGIANRSFNKIFHLADTIEVNDASVDNGLLTIELEQNIPDHKKPRTIELK